MNLLRLRKRKHQSNQNSQNEITIQRQRNRSTSSIRKWITSQENPNENNQRKWTKHETVTQVLKLLQVIKKTMAANYITEELKTKPWKSSIELCRKDKEIKLKMPNALLNRN